MAEAVMEQVQAMGAVVLESGVSFRVWAPNAQFVSVVGTFNNWDELANPLEQSDDGKWSLIVPEARIGDEYRYLIRNADKKISRIDPYTRQVTNSVGNGVIANLTFDWSQDTFQLPPINELVIYEMHIGTFGKSEDDGMPSTFQSAIADLDYLQKLGINCIEIMPIAEFAGDYSWGYNPAHLFAVETAYGGPQAFQDFIIEAHRRGIGVILDVVYNHFGPSDIDLWQFDGWSENGMGGIYFYNDWRAETPWGQTRPDYGRHEVRQMIYENARMWLEEYHVDGLRMDMTLFIRHVSGSGDPGQELPDGWSLIQWINKDLHEMFPGKITIAEDLQNNDFLTKPVNQGGAGYSAQWDARFVHPIREVAIIPEDDDRNMDAIKNALLANYNLNPFQRVIYTESHDEVANGKARVTSEVMVDDPQNYFALKRSTLAAGLVFTAPGIPMIFQGQEFLEDEWFRDNIPLDWDKAENYPGIIQMYRDLISLRLNHQGQSKGLIGSGIEILHQDNDQKTMAFHRWYEHGQGDDVVVVLNFKNKVAEVPLRMPTHGHWKCLFNSDAKVYSKKFPGTHVEDVLLDSQQTAEPQTTLSIGPYTMLVFGWHLDQ